MLIMFFHQIFILLRRNGHRSNCRFCCSGLSHCLYLQHAYIVNCLQSNGQFPRAAVASIRIPAVRPRAPAAAASGAYAGARAGAPHAALRAHVAPPHALPSAREYIDTFNYWPLPS